MLDDTYISSIQLCASPQLISYQAHSAPTHLYTSPRLHGSGTSAYCMTRAWRQYNCTLHHAYTAMQLLCINALRHTCIAPSHLHTRRQLDNCSQQCNLPHLKSYRIHNSDTPAYFTKPVLLLLTCILDDTCVAQV